MKLSTKIAGLALLCVALDSGALTLGSLRGVAVLGQPLDIAVQIQMDGGEDAAALCFDAEIFHGDTHQEARQVRIAVEKAAQTRMTEVRVRSSAVVDEPVVTLNLSYGCGQKISRRYVLLADLPSYATVAATSPAVAPAVPAPAAVKPELTLSTAIAAGRPALAVAASTAKDMKPVAPTKVAALRPGTRRPRAVNADLVSPKRAAADGKTKSGRPSGTPRLKLDPLEILSDRIANLDSYMTFEPTADALQNLQKMKTLEGEVKVLRESAAKNERNLADLKARLQQAETGRFSSVVIYVLAALVLACLLLLAWLWSRQRRGSADDWWRDAGADQLAPAVQAERGLVSRETSVRQNPEPAHELQGSRVASAEAGSSSNIDAHSVQLSDSAFSDFLHPGMSARKQGNRSTTPTATLGTPTKLVRSLNSDAVAQIRRLAEKLLALGKPEQAVAILKKQIRESDEPNPFVYLDLLSIFHSLNQKNDFQQFCQDFNLLFNGRVQEFAFFEDEGKGLESYPDTLSRITELWSTPKVLELIETCIFRDPWAASGVPFDLAAMRDLLLLHAIAQSLVLAGVSAHGEPLPDTAPQAEAPASQQAHLDYVDSVASTFPSFSKSALADLFESEKELPQVLDLDLSEVASQRAAAEIAPASEVDLALLIPGDHEAHQPPVVGTDVPEAQSASVSQRRNLR